MFVMFNISDRTKSDDSDPMRPILCVACIPILVFLLGMIEIEGKSSTEKLIEHIFLLRNCMSQSCTQRSGVETSPVAHCYTLIFSKYRGNTY